MEILTNIRAVRLAADMTQEELAQRMGVHPAAVCQWERGRNYPRMELAIRMACILDCGLDDIFPAARQYHSSA